MYTIVEYVILLMLAVLACATLFVLSIGFMIVEEATRFITENSYRLALRLPHLTKRAPAHNPASQPLSSH